MKITVVVVDDEEIDRYIFKRLLKDTDLDLNLVEFEDGHQFIEAVRDSEKSKSEFGNPISPILVFLDINMPRMNGFEVLEALRTELADKNGYMVVTMYSSSSHAQDRQDASKYDFVDDYIVKPVTPELLDNLVKKLHPDG